MLELNKTKRTIIVGTNSLVSTTQPAYANHCQLWYHFGKDFPDINFIFVNPSRMGIDRMRNMCGKAAIEYNADYILFLDDDVLVPMQCLKYLLEANADIVAGDVLIRGYPFNHMAFRCNLISDRFDLEGKDLKAIPAWRPEEIGKVVDVDAIGFSLCLIKVNLLRKIPTPWFQTGPRNTEDVYFCMKARLYDPSTTIKVDTRIECAHILWAETINTSTRKNYREFMEKQFGFKVESVLDQSDVNPYDVAPEIKQRDSKESVVNYSDLLNMDLAGMEFIK